MTKTSSLTISLLRNQLPPSPQYSHRNHLIQWTLPARVLVLRYPPQVESSRTHFKVLGLGLEAYKSSKMFCPRFENSIISWLVKKENNQTKDHINFCSVNSFPFLIWKIIQYDSQLSQVNTSCSRSYSTLSAISTKALRRMSPICQQGWIHSFFF